MSRYFYSSIFFVIFVSICSCQTNEVREFSKIHVGMEKVDVIEVMGSPLRSERKNGIDEWTYVFYKDQVRFEKQVHFVNGKATYVGDIPTPTISAEKQDEINAKENKKIEENLEQNKNKNKKSFEEYEKKVLDNKEIKYLPVFKPIQ